MKGAKTGGRKAGTPNKRSLETAAMLEANGFDPDMPWIYWSRVLRSHLAAVAPGAEPGFERGESKGKRRKKAPPAEVFYQGRVVLAGGEGEGTYLEEIYAPATAEMADKAAKELARYIRPQLMRIQGTGSGGALLVEFAEDHRSLPPGKSGNTGGRGQLTARVHLPAAGKVKPL